MALSDAACRGAKSNLKPHRLSDGNGLFLLVQPSGSKAWQYFYRFQGRQKILSIGRYPAIGLADARDAAETTAAAGLGVAGRDPLQLRGQPLRCGVRRGDHLLRTGDALIECADQRGLPGRGAGRRADRLHVAARTVDEVAASLAADLTLAAVSDVSFQVHSIAATHELTLRSLQLLADEVAPRLGFATGPEAAADLHHAHRALVTASSEGLS